MKDMTQADLESNRPKLDVREAIDFCLERLYADRVHETTHAVVDGLTYEELIGALLLARDAIARGDGR